MFSLHQNLKTCNNPLEGGHILAHFKVEVIKQPPDNNFGKTSSQIQVNLNTERGRWLDKMSIQDIAKGIEEERSK